MKVLVVGAGAMGRHHVRNYAAMPHISQVFVVEPSEESRAKLGAMQLDSKVTVCKSLEEALKNKIDAASVVVPTQMHAQTAGILLEKKIPCLVEKPLAANIEEGIALKALAEKHNVLLVVGHIERFNPAVQALKARIKDLGKIVYASAHRFGMPSPRKLGHAFFDQAVHDIDVLCYLTGSKPKKVQAVQQTFNDDNDLASALLDFGGFYASVEANRVTPIKTRELIIVGTEGSARLDYITQDLTVTIRGKEVPDSNTFDEIVLRVGKGTELRPYFVKKEPLRAELEHFIACVQGKEKPQCTASDGLNAIAAAEACVKSASEGKAIEVRKTA